MSAHIRLGFGCGLILLIAFSSQSQAATVFIDDFEGYSDQAAFATSWSMNGFPPHVLDTTLGRNSSHSIRLVPQGKWKWHEQSLVSKSHHADLAY